MVIHPQYYVRNLEVIKNCSISFLIHKQSLNPRHSFSYIALKPILYLTFVLELPVVRASFSHGRIQEPSNLLLHTFQSYLQLFYITYCTILKFINLSVYVFHL